MRGTTAVTFCYLCSISSANLLFCFHSIIQKNTKNNKIQKNKKCFLTVFHQEPPLEIKPFCQCNYVFETLSNCLQDIPNTFLFMLFFITLTRIKSYLRKLHVLLFQIFIFLSILKVNKAIRHWYQLSLLCKSQMKYFYIVDLFMYFGTILTII